MGGFPLDEVTVRSKTGTAEVYGKQTTSWLSTYNEDYVVVTMVEQGGTGSGAAGDSVRRIWEALYGIDGSTVRPGKALIPGTTPPTGLPTVNATGLIDPPPAAAPARDSRRSQRRLADRRSRRPGRPE
jgi:penicillin-binding protein 2